MRSPFGRALTRVLHRPAAGTGALTGVATAGILLTALMTGLPTPSIHDEFAYLLTADTFLEGRLTNPTHRLWPHFETFQVIHQPTYQAKYPPAQGLFLAVGTMLGHPVFGVWLGVLLMIACIAWGLRGFLPPGWALLGTLLPTLSLGVASYWAQSYWGGAVAAAGGALVFGFGARTIRGSARLRDGILGGIGLVLLANARPLEGLIFTLVVAAGIAITRFRRLAPRTPIGTVLSALTLGMAGVGLTAAYNHAVTGDALTFPYVVHERQYALAPTLLLSAPREADRAYRHAQMARFYEVWDRERHRRMRIDGISGFLWRATALPAAIGPATVLLLFVPLVWRVEGTKLAVASIIAIGLPVVLTKAAFPHYFAPAIVAAYYLITVVTRRLWRTMKGRLLGRPLIVGIMLIAVLDPVNQVAEALSRDPDWSDERQSVARRLRAEPGRDLVVVHYSPTHPAYQEWVYNRADIDGADVVCARSMGPAADSVLIRYFDDRRVWQLEVGDPPVLTEIRRTAPSGR